MIGPIDDLSISVPEFYATNCVCECAGSGNLRLLFYVMRRGIAVPVYSAVHSLEHLVDIGTSVKAAIRALKEARGAVH